MSYKLNESGVDHLPIRKLLTKETNAAEAQLLKLGLKLKKLQQKNSKYESVLDNRIATFENRLHKRMVAYNSVLGKAFISSKSSFGGPKYDFRMPKSPFLSSKCQVARRNSAFARPT